MLSQRGSRSVYFMTIGVFSSFLGPGCSWLTNASRRTNVAPHVKNKRECVWQGASSREEAEDLFEQAMRKGNVHIIPNNHARSPTSSASQAGSVQSSSSRSSSSRGNPQHSRHTSIPRLAGSQSERHVRSNASYYEPACTNPGEMNTNNSAWDKAGAGGSKVARALSRTHSEPGQYAHSPNSVKGGGHSPSGISVSRGEVETRSQVKPDNARIYARVESPSWLASYPDEEDEAFITPPLSPITSPMISSRLLGPSKSEPASTFSANFASASVIGKKPASDDGSDTLNFRSPKPVHQAASFSVFSPRPQESLSGEADGVLGIGGQKQPQKDEANVGSSRPTPRRVDATQIEQSRVESLIDLVNTVDRLVKDLRIQIVSPSTDDNPLPDGAQDRADETRYHSPTSALSEDRNDLPDATSPCSGSPHLKRRQTNTAEPSELKNLVDMGVPSSSVLFSHSRTLYLGYNHPSLNVI